MQQHHLLLVRRGFETVAGGAFMYLDDETAEIKRMWTSSNHRRQGLSRAIMAALEEEITARGYRRIYLTTGPRQPEARNLYLALGYTPLFDVDGDIDAIGKLAFEKEIVPQNPGVEVRGLRNRVLAWRQRRIIKKSFRWREYPEVRLRDLAGKTTA